MRAVIMAVVLLAGLAEARNGQRLFREMARTAVGGGVAAKTASLLLHFDEDSGSTNIVDSGKHGLAVISLVGAQTTNSPTKFGNAAAFNNTTSRRFTVAWTNDFWPGTNDWSVDCWIYSDNASAAPSVNRYVMGDNTSGNRSWLLIRRRSIPDYRIDLSTNGTALTSSLFSYDIAAVSNAWMHLAVWRKKNTLYAATNGALVSLTFTNLAGFNFAPTNTRPLPIGTPINEVAFFGIDEFRYCLGDAMPYGTTSFTPPTAPYTGTE